MRMNELVNCSTFSIETDDYFSLREKDTVQYGQNIIRSF